MPLNVGACEFVPKLSPAAAPFIPAALKKDPISPIPFNPPAATTTSTVPAAAAAPASTASPSPATKLSKSAKPFIPNPSAPVFVPGGAALNGAFAPPTTAPAIALAPPGTAPSPALPPTAASALPFIPSTAAAAATATAPATTTTPATSTPATISSPVPQSPLTPATGTNGSLSESEEMSGSESDSSSGSRRKYDMAFLLSFRHKCTDAPGNMNRGNSFGYEPHSGSEASSSASTPNPRHQRGGKRSQARPVRPEVAPLAKGENRWTRQAEKADDADQVEKTLRTLKGLLNKLTVDNFERLLKQCLEIEPVSLFDERILASMIDLLFEKAVAEPYFCPLYSQLCQRIAVAEAQDDADSTTTFRAILLKKCQDEFENKFAPTADDSEEDPETRAKARMLGNIKFIGELYKTSLINADVMHQCVHTLFGADGEEPDAEKIEALAKLLTTIGEHLDKVHKGTMNQYFDKLDALSKLTDKISSRIRFMLLDVIDLRKRNWAEREGTSTSKPKALAEFKAEAAEEEAARAKTDRRPKRPEQPKKDPRNARPVKRQEPAKQVVDDGWSSAPTKKGKPVKAAPAPAPVPAAKPAAKTQASKGGFAALMNDTDSEEEEEEEEEEEDVEEEEDEEEEEEDEEEEEEEVAVAVEPAAPEVDEEADEKIHKPRVSLMREFLSCHDLSEAVLATTELKGSKKGFVVHAVQAVLESKEKDRELVRSLLTALAKDGWLDAATMAHSAAVLVERVEDAEIDIPRVGEHVASVVGDAVGNQLLSLSIAHSLLPHVTARRRPATLFALLAAAASKLSREELAEKFKAVSPRLDLSILASDDTLKAHELVVFLLAL